MKNLQKCICLNKPLVFCIIVSFLFVLFFLRHYLNSFYFQNDVNKISFNLESSYKGEGFICFEGKCDVLNYENGVYFYKLNSTKPIFYNGEINSFEILSKDETLFQNAKSLGIFLGNNFIKKDKDTLHFNKIKLQNETFYKTKIQIKNNKTFLQKAGLYFESLFYNWYFYLISYILILIYLNLYQGRFDFKIKYPIIIILTIGLFLRLSHINFVPFWNDELYVLTKIFNNNFNIFSNCFNDAGNPPLFFVLANFWLLFFNKSIFSIRFLSLILGLVQIGSIYFILNKVIDKKAAILASFLSAINIFVIVESNEIRSYILSMSLVLWGGYWFYKLLKDFSNKNLIIYLIFSSLLINCHYYCIFFVLANFILGCFLFKNNKKKFILGNFISFLTFLPYFLNTFLLKSLDNSFNTWLEKPSIDLIYSHIIFYFGNIFFFILTIIFCVFVFQKLKNKEKNIFLYNVYVISLSFVFAFLISIFVKPILFERYFCIFLPLLIINTTILILIDYNFKIKFLIPFLVFLFSINMPKYENYNLFSNISQVAQFYGYDVKYNENKENYFITPDFIDYIKYYPFIDKTKTIVSNYGVREDVDLMKFYLSQVKETKKEIVFYLPEICMNSKIKFMKDNKNIKIRKFETNMVPIYKIYITKNL